MNKSTKAIDKELYQVAMNMLNSGKRTSDIAKELDVNRSTINSWKCTNGRVRDKTQSFDVTSLLKTQQNKENYSYIFGMLLGKGFIYKCPRTYRITTYVNKINMSAVDYTVNIFKKFFTSKTYTFDKTLTNGRKNLEIVCHSGKLKYLFPQYIVGKSADREIKLTEWQETAIDPVMLIKGLIVSCGLLFINPDTNKLNVKFLHKSSDVVDIFEKYSSALGFEYKRYIRNNFHIVDVSNFKNYAFLKELESLKKLSNDVSKLSSCSEKFNERIFENIDTKEKAYWLGFLYADGNVNTKHNRIGFHLAYKDVVLLERFCDFVGGDRSKIVSYNNNETVFYYISSSDMKNDLAKHNLLPNKTYKKEFPIIEDYELFLAFFLGVFDGDGSKSNSSLVSGNKEFLEYCCERLELDKNKIRLQINPYGSCYSLYINSNKYIEILKNYSNSLERKR